ncbi:MAG: FKBP-type peptidyl-prolyl cis-trans isomerase [bacterium]|nr:FKBP-type peptidyl-prolyl cis-trans isomerase [bacterium]
MNTKYYPLLGGILVLVVVGFLFWQKNITATKNLADKELLATISESINKNPNNNMENQSTTSDELKIEVLQQGTGPEAKNGDIVSVHYTGYLTNGQVFDSSIGRGQPFSFTLGAGQVIKGWDQGVLGMKVGEKRKLTIPSDLAYGTTGAGGVIPPNATLVFEVEMIKINDTP